MSNWRPIVASIVLASAAATSGCVLFGGPIVARPTPAPASTPTATTTPCSSAVCGATPTPTAMPSSCSTATPCFAGLKSATTCIPGPIAPTTTTSYHLTWDPATDQATPSSEIVYLIYQATRPGGEDFSTPTYTTAPGVTSFVTPALPADESFYFVVRARDLAGNVDSNKVEHQGVNLCL